MTGSLPDTAQVFHRTLSDNGRGGKAESYASAFTTACRIGVLPSRKAGEAEVASGVKADELMIVTMPYGTAILQTDRLVIRGVTYRVVSPVLVTSFELGVRFHVTPVSAL